LKKFLLLLLLSACAQRVPQTSPDLVSIQLLDRNGFSETISAHDRLTTYEHTNFLTPQPYQKVVRVYGKASQGKTASKISTYHSNGLPWQYLEIENGRAHGKFCEWHPNGQLKIEAFVIEGTPDVSQMAQTTWFFDQTSTVFDDKGRCLAKILYEKGLLEGISSYYHENGEISRLVPYLKDQIHGQVTVLDAKGFCTETIPYTHGEKEGTARAYWTPTQLKYQEKYTNGKLLSATYFSPDGSPLSSIVNGHGEQALFHQKTVSTLITYKDGIIEGIVKNLSPDGHLLSTYLIKEGLKQGEEWQYFPSSSPKLCLQWNHDTIQGTCKTWYENGILESQREMHDNKKHGLSFAWFAEGDLMLMEEYEDDLLMKGSYYKKFENKPTSTIEHGAGVATLFDKEGKFLKKITYEKGLPQKEG
jgi:antitoxin component YwqK of YwqJK toxin-antitoxin module